MRLLTLAACMALAGCTQMLTPPQYEPRVIVQTRDSEFEPTVRFVGVEALFPGHPWNRHFLRSWLDKETGTVRHQLYVVNYYSGDWRFWRSASDRAAESLDVTAIRSDVISCSRYSGCLYVEEFGVRIPDDALARNPAGYAVKVYARSGHEMILTVSAHQIERQLGAIERYRSRIAREAHP